MEIHIYIYIYIYTEKIYRERVKRKKKYIYIYHNYYCLYIRSRSPMGVEHLGEGIVGRP